MKRKLVTLAVLAGLMMLMLSACSATPLAKAYKQLAKIDVDDVDGLEVRYSEETDSLDLKIESTAAAEQVFEILSECCSEQDVGRIYIAADENLNDEHVDKTAELLGALNCNSIQMLGLSSNILEKRTWTPVLGKVGLMYTDFLPNPGTVPDDVKNLSRLAVGDATLYNISEYPQLSELAVNCYDMMHVPEPVEEGAQAEDGTAAEDQAAEDQAAAEENAAAEDASAETGDSETADAEAAEGAETAVAVETYVFSGGNVSSSIKKSSLERLLIAPAETTYKCDEEGDAFLFYLQNYKPELLVNAPGHEIKYDSEGKVDALSLTKVSDVELTELGDERRAEILDNVLMQEAESVYKKAVKFKASGSEPVVKGKALIVMVDPDEIYDEITWWNEGGFWPEKRVWAGDSFIDILNSKEVGGKIPTPDLSKDYDTLVYAYPVYTRVGSYTSGTKAYQLAYYCQVFDLKGKKAYGAKKITSVEPHDKIYYSGTPQDKASARVDRSKVIKYIKKLKTS